MSILNYSVFIYLFILEKNNVKYLLIIKVMWRFFQRKIILHAALSIVWCKITNNIYFNVLSWSVYELLVIHLKRTIGDPLENKL